MSRRFKVWLDSGANIHSCYKTTTSLEALGLTSEEFDEMSESEKEEMFREIAFTKGCWGWEEEPNNAE